MDAHIWLERVKRAVDHRMAWEKKFKCNALEQYYEGFHYEDTSNNPYTINLFYSSIETKMPSLLFLNPTFTVKPKPKSLFYDSEAAFSIARNLEMTLADWLANPDNKFTEEVEAATLDSWFRFGILEVGYSSDWIENPRAKKPPLRSDYKKFTEGILKQPVELPINEQVYVKYIPSDRFVVSMNDSRFLEQCDWVGYYEWHRIEDLKNNKKLKTDELNATIYTSSEFVNYEEMNEEVFRQSGYEKIWKIWDQRLKKFFILAEWAAKEIYSASFEFLPFEDLRFRRRRKGFYPLPPTFNWISPQNEINEVRESNRNHRRRFKRVYTSIQGMIDHEEAVKLINGPDGTVVEVNGPNAVLPVPTADLGASHRDALIISKDDFNIISATTSEARGESDRTTATQAAITNQRSQIRESRERVLVANFLTRIAYKVLKTMKQKLVNPYIVSQPTESNFMADIDTESRATMLDPITDLGDEEFDVQIDIQVDSSSPIANDLEKNKFIEFIALMSQFPQFSMSPLLIREMAFRVGYYNEKVIREFQKFAQLAMLGQVSMGEKQLQAGGNMGQQTVAQMTPPNQEQVRNQLNGQGIPL